MPGLRPGSPPPSWIRTRVRTSTWWGGIFPGPMFIPTRTDGWGPIFAGWGAESQPPRKGAKEGGLRAPLENPECFVYLPFAVAGLFLPVVLAMKKGLERLAATNVKNISLTDFDTIAQVAAEENYIKAGDIASMAMMSE